MYDFFILYNNIIMIIYFFYVELGKRSRIHELEDELREAEFDRDNLKQ